METLEAKINPEAENTTQLKLVKNKTKLDMYSVMYAYVLCINASELLVI